MNEELKNLEKKIELLEKEVKLLEQINELYNLIEKQKEKIQQPTIMPIPLPHYPLPPHYPTVTTTTTAKLLEKLGTDTEELTQHHGEE